MGEDSPDEDDPAEFATVDEAEIVAQRHSLCDAWGYNIIEVP